MRRGRSRRLRFLMIAMTVIACVAVACFLFPELLLARAGGGGGYSGGGGGGGGGGGFGGGGSSGSGGGGGGWIIYFLIRLCIERPLIGIPLVIVIIAVFMFMSHQGQDRYVTSVIRRGKEALNDNERAAAVGRLRAEDPAFDELKFYDRVRAAFLQIQSAWCDQQIERVRAFVSDGILERFSLQIDEQRERGYRDHMESISVSSVRLAQLQTNEFFDEITVCIAASAIDYRMSLKEGRRLSGAITAQPFVEYWTFLRRRGAKTDDQPGLIEGACPNCGADIRMNQSERCASCESLLRSGQYDWVLTEITQACEWTGDEPRRVVNVDWFREHVDAGLQVRHLEDRASVVFWRKASADRLGDVRPLAKMASPEFCADYEGQIAGASNGERKYWGECAVGSVDVLAILPDSEWDRALVEVRWSGTRLEQSRGGPPKSLGSPATLRTLFVLSRRRGVKTNVELTIASAHCPKCGAPESSLASHACDFCGETLNDGRWDWTLTALHLLSSAEAQKLLHEARDHAESNVQDFETLANRPPRASQQLAWAIKMALADHALDQRERQLLERAAARRQVSTEWLDAMILAAQRSQLDLPVPADRVEARRWLASLADVSLWDGRVHESEFKLLCQAGASFDLAPYDVRQLVQERRAVLYRKAREQLRQGRARRSDAGKNGANGSEEANDA